MVVAENLGHSDTRIVEKHYAHLGASYVADEIRKGERTFGFNDSIAGLIGHDKAKTGA
jgi:hypothetical protein